MNISAFLMIENTILQREVISSYILKTPLSLLRTTNISKDILYEVTSIFVRHYTPSGIKRMTCGVF